MLFVSDANILKYFRAIKSIDFYKHFISIDHLSFIFLHFLLWPQNIKEIPVPTQWLFLTSKNPLKLPTADKVPKSIYVILINIRYKQEKQKKKKKSLRAMLMSLGPVPRSERSQRGQSWAVQVVLKEIPSGSDGELIKLELIP